jgi:two-component system, cell cycle sensor histidine kinase and response regulator CckA
VDSNTGNGTIFSLLFSGGNEIMGFADDQGSEHENKMIPSPESTSARYVLVIDDQDTVCEAVVDILDLESIPVITALSGQAGIDIYDERQADIGLVLLDLSMPGMNGHETYQGLQKINPQVSVIISSGYDEEEVLRRFNGPGLVGFLKKPYNLGELIDTVKQHMGL